MVALSVLRAATQRTTNVYNLLLTMGECALNNRVQLQVGLSLHIGPAHQG